jgi:acetylglutamate kinase
MNITIIKLSGKVIEQLQNDNRFIESIKTVKKNYGKPILVHGAGSEINKWSQMLGINSSYYNGHRVTDDITMEVVAAVQGGLVNTKIVSRLQTCGIDSIGLSGVDRGLLKAEYLNKNIGYVGNPIMNGSVKWIKDLCSQNVLPVFSSVCKDNKGNLMNVNADLFSQTLAIGLESKIVFFLSDVNGLKLDGEFQHVVSIDQIKVGLDSGEIKDGMLPKVLSCSELISHGVEKVWMGTMDDFINIQNKEKEGNYGTWIVGSRKIAI